MYSHSIIVTVLGPIAFNVPLDISTVVKPTTKNWGTTPPQTKTRNINDFCASPTFCEHFKNCDTTEPQKLKTQNFFCCILSVETHAIVFRCDLIPVADESRSSSAQRFPRSRPSVAMQPPYFMEDRSNF